jgi:hypothetical protein
MLYKIENKLNKISETSFNKNIIDRKKFSNVKKIKIKKNINYWNVVSKEIQKAANNKNEKYFFRNWAVILHLASEDHSLGYKFIKKIKDHKIGEELLSKCQTPNWGSPFLLKKFPFLSPTTASHLVNIISIYDSFGNEFKKYKNIVDFGGGYGGLAKCLCEISDNFKINIIDLPKMLEIQKKYIIKTSNFKKRIFFNKNFDSLSGRYCLFNASFSFSEVPLNQRKIIENFIKNKCKRIHIIYQNNFNDVDNIEYMKKFALKLRNKNWKISFKPYGYEAESKYIMYGKYKKI